MSDDGGHPVSYKLLAPGTPVFASDGIELGTAERAVENVEEVRKWLFLA